MSSRSLRTAITQAIGEFTGYRVDAISDTHDLADDLGVDSMAAASLLAAIEDHFGVLLPDGCEGRLVGVRTVGELIDSLTAIYGVGTEGSPEVTGSSTPALANHD